MKTLTAAVLLLTATAANADLYGGGHYTQIDLDGVKLDGLGASLGYELAISPESSAIIELRAGTGFKSDDYSGVDIEMDEYHIISFKAKHETESGIYALGMVSRATIDITASYNGNEISATDSETGFGVGLGYDFETSQTDVELTVEKFDEATVATINFKFDF